MCDAQQDLSRDSRQWVFSGIFEAGHFSLGLLLTSVELGGKCDILLELSVRMNKNPQAYFCVLSEPNISSSRKE